MTNTQSNRGKEADRLNMDTYCEFGGGRKGDKKKRVEAKTLNFLDFQATERHAGYKRDGKLDQQQVKKKKKKKDDDDAQLASFPHFLLLLLLLFSQAMENQYGLFLIRTASQHVILCHEV